MKTGDKVKIKSKAWYKKRLKDHNGCFDCGGTDFTKTMSTFCGSKATITVVDPDVPVCTLDIDEGQHYWNNEMFE